MAKNDVVGVMQNGILVTPLRESNATKREFDEVRKRRTSHGSRFREGVLRRYAASYSGVDWGGESVAYDMIGDSCSFDSLPEARKWLFDALSHLDPAYEHVTDSGVGYAGGEEHVTTADVRAWRENPHQELAHLTEHCDKLSLELEEAQTQCRACYRHAADESDYEEARDLRNLADEYARLAYDLHHVIDDYRKLRDGLEEELKSR